MAALARSLLFGRVTSRRILVRTTSTLTSSSSEQNSTVETAKRELDDEARRRSQKWRGLRPRDRFGGMTSDPVRRHEEDRDARDLRDGDGEDEYLDKIADSTRPSRADFNRRIVKFLREDDLAGALKVLDVEMKEEERSPLEGHYRVLIHACGKAGYHGKAFQLYKEYNSRSLKPSQGVCADLFNSCANSPFPEDALEKARFLRRKLVHLRLDLAQVVYHNMLKAFGRCGDLETAFLIVDEMRERKVPVDGDTYCHLLQGCISDRETGFRHAVLIWRSMLRGRVALVPAHFHLLLRAARDCGAGDGDFHRDILLACMTVEEARRHGQRLLEAQKPPEALAAPQEGKKSEEEGEGVEEKGETTNFGRGPYLKKPSFAMMIPSEMVEFVPEKEKSKVLKNEGLLPVHGARLPSVLDPKPSFDGVVAIGSLALREQRLALLGGPAAICAAMRRRRLEPDAKAFGFMLDMAADTEEAEAALLAFMDREGVKPDTIMLNMLIKRRSCRKDYKLGLSALSLFSRYDASPDLITFGVLALCCRNRRDMNQLLSDMRRQGFRPNMEILGTLVNNACRTMDPTFVTFALGKAEASGLDPSPRLLRDLERFHHNFRRHVLFLEREKRPPEAETTDVSVRGAKKSGSNDRNFVPPAVRRDRDERGFAGWREFRERYAGWLARAEVDAGAEAHPWRQYLNRRDVERARHGDSAVRDILEGDGGGGGGGGRGSGGDLE